MHYTSICNATAKHKKNSLKSLSMGIKFHYEIKSEVQNSLKEKFDDDKFKISNDRKKCLCRDEKIEKLT